MFSLIDFIIINSYFFCIPFCILFIQSVLSDYVTNNSAFLTGLFFFSFLISEGFYSFIFLL